MQNNDGVGSIDHFVLILHAAIDGDETVAQGLDGGQETSILGACQPGFGHGYNCVTS